MPRHHPRPGSSCRHGLWRAMRQALVVVVSLSLASLVPGVPRGGVAFAAVGPDEARQAMQQMLDALEGLRDGVDRTRVDVEALAFELAFADADEIVAFVRDEIAFVAYDGVLRGAQGAVVDGSANAMDQALLTTTLLTSAGYDVRLGQGRIGRTDAERLVASMRPAAVDGRGMPDPARLEAFAQAIGLDVAGLDSVAASADTARAGFEVEVEAAVRSLESQIGASGATADHVVDELVEAARAYAWVEYGFGGEWERAHPAFGDGAPPETLEVDGYVEDVVPDDLVHSVRVQVFIEQRRGDELFVSPVTDAWERPIVTLHGRAITYVNLPDGLSEVEDAMDVEALLEQTTFFTPLIESEFAPGALSFDLNGSTAPPTVAMDQAAGVVRETGGLFGTAAGALAGEADPDDFVTLTAQWIEYTLVEPGGRETVHRRTIVDRIGVERRDAGIVEVDPAVSAADVAEAMTRTHTFMVAPGRYSEAFVFDAQLSATLEARELLTRILDAGVALEADVELPNEFVDSSRPIDLLQAFATFDDAPVRPDVLAYRAVPSLVVVERAWDGSSAVVDVVQNRQVVLEAAGDGLPSPAPGAARTIGVWETFTEGLPIVHADARRWNTFTVFEAALEQGIEVRALAPGQAAAVRDLDLPEATRRAIAADLDAGFAVVAPVRVPDGSPFASWWRSDPVTGETLGRGDDGRGMEYQEYLLALETSQQLLRAGLIFSGTRILTSCLAAASPPAYACCVYENVLLSGALLGIGAVIGGFFAVSAIGMFIVLDLVVGTGTMVAGMAWDGMPSICSGIAGVCRVRLLV